jgi:hypothetical protein
MLRACYTNSKEEEEEEEAAASAVCITRKANKNNNNNNRCVKKQHLYYGPLCSFPYARALRCLHFPSFFFFFYRSCRFFLCLGKEPREQHRTRKSKRRKTFFSVLIIKLFFPEM